MLERERGICLWVISDDGNVLRQVHQALHDHACCTKAITCAEAMDTRLWREEKCSPGAVLIDVGDALDWAEGVLRQIKRTHSRTPIIVLSREPSKEFGMKIVSAGISYFLPRDFDARELREVVTGLIRT